MRCTKCNGSGSEGFISFLRCGRCGGSGDEPKDALIPYSPDLIVVPDGPVITALKEDPEAVEKKLTEASEKKKQASAVAPAPRTGRGWDAFGAGAAYRPAASQRYMNSGAAVNNAPPVEEKEIPVFHGTEYVDFEVNAKSRYDLKIDLQFVWDYFGNRSPHESKIILKEVFFESERRYIVEFSYQAMRQFSKFYTKLGLPAIPVGECEINMMTNAEFIFNLECLERYEDYIDMEDRMIVTVMFNIVERESMIHRPQSGYGYGYPSYGTR